MIPLFNNPYTSLTTPTHKLISLSHNPVTLFNEPLPLSNNHRPLSFINFFFITTYFSNSKPQTLCISIFILSNSDLKTLKALLILNCFFFYFVTNSGLTLFKFGSNSDSGSDSNSAIPESRYINNSIVSVLRLFKNRALALFLSSFDSKDVSNNRFIMAA